MDKKELFNISIVDNSIEYSGSCMPRLTDEPDVSSGAKLLAYEVLEGTYGNAPYRKDNIYKAVMTYVNFLCDIRRSQ